MLPEYKEPHAFHVRSTCVPHASARAMQSIGTTALGNLRVFSCHDYAPSSVIKFECTANSARARKQTEARQSVTADVLRSATLAETTFAPRFADDGSEPGRSTFVAEVGLSSILVGDLTDACEYQAMHCRYLGQSSTLLDHACVYCRPCTAADYHTLKWYLLC